MRRVRYSVVMSLDGYIAGPKGEADWITTDPEVDFTALFSQFDTILVGRRTFDAMVAAGRPSIPGMKTIVFSRTLRQEDHLEVAIVTDGQGETLAAMKAASGKDLWLFGGGALFRSLVEDGLVDTVEVGIVPILVREFRCCRAWRSGSNCRSQLTVSAEQAWSLGVRDHVNFAGTNPAGAISLYRCSPNSQIVGNSYLIAIMEGLPVIRSELPKRLTGLN